MGVRLFRQKTTSTFLSPFNEFKPTTVTIEIRRDPVTPHRARILSFRFRDLAKKNLDDLVEQSLKTGCPFCPENLFRKAARFTEDLVPEGIIQKGEAVIFPNAFPYEKHNGVCVLCAQHFVPIEGFKSEWIFQALLACRDYFRLLKTKEPKTVYGSINWNFLPLSGAGLIHPHFQLVAQTRPTRYMGEMLKKTKGHFQRHKRPFFSDLLQQEKTAGERYIGQTGTVHWLSAFAPLGIMEIMALWEGANDFLTLPEKGLNDFSRGLVRVLRFLGGKNIYSLNMALYLLLEEQDHFPLLAKIIPRIDLPPLSISEINYFERLHHEIFTFYPPEDVAAETKPFFDETVKDYL
jgi:UDPglucose--hexose-1-phosphate uridylyltransferase